MADKKDLMGAVTKLFSFTVTFVCLLFVVAVSFFAFFDSDKFVLWKFGNFKPVLFLATAVLLLFFFTAFSTIEKSNVRKLFIINIAAVIALAAGQVFILTAFDIMNTTDPYMVQDQALAIANGLDKTIDTSYSPYFAGYSNNDFSVLFAVFVDKAASLFNIENNTRLLAVLNAIFTDIGILLLYKTVGLLWNRKKATEVLLLSVMNPLNYLMLWWTYTCTFSVPLMIGVVYLAAVFYKTKSRSVQYVSAILLGVILALGYFIRPTVLIPGIGAVICFVLFYKKIRYRLDFKRVITVSAAMLMALVLTFGITKLQVQKISGDDSKNFPITHWVMMGLHGNGEVSYYDMLFTRSFETPQEMQQAHISEIKATLSDMDAKEFAEHMLKKLEVNWANGPSAYFGRMMPDNNFSFAYNWLAGEKRDIAELYCQSFRLATLVITAVGLAIQLSKKRNHLYFLFTICLFGGFVFYLLWEVKGAYSIPFLPFFFVICTGSVNISSLKNKRYIKPLAQTAGIAVVLLTVLSSIICFKPMTEMKFTDRQYSINCSHGIIDDYTDNISTVSKENISVSQTFSAKFEFDRISIAAQKLNNADTEYEVALYSGNEKVSSKNVNSSMIKGVFLTVDFEKQPAKDELYTVKITPLRAGAKDSISWHYVTSKVLDQYEGTLTAGNSQMKEDLNIKVFNQYTSTYMSVWLYIVLCISLLCVEIALVCVLRKEKLKK